MPTKRGALPPPRSKFGFLRLFVNIFSNIGSGPAGLEGLIGSAGFSLAILAICVFPLFVAVPQAFITLELTNRFHEFNGGLPVWLYRATKRKNLVFVATCFIVIFNCSTAALVSESTVAYVNTVSSVFDASWRKYLLSIGIVLFSYVVSLGSIDTVAAVFWGLSIQALVAFGVLIILCCFTLDFKRIDNPVTTAKSVHPSFLLDLLIFNSNGYDSGGGVVAFVRNPHTTVPRATLAAAVFSTVLYVAIFGTTYLGSRESASAWKESQFSYVAREVGGPAIQIWIVITCALINAQMFVGALVSAVYTLHGAASLGAFPSYWEAATEEGTPWRALAFCTGLSIVLCALPFSWNLAFSAVFFSLVLLGQIACFAALPSDGYAFLPRSRLCFVFVVVVPTIVAVLALAVQPVSLLLASAALVGAIFIAAPWVVPETMEQVATTKQEQESMFRIKL